jgi:hypothetical protein
MNVVARLIGLEASLLLAVGVFSSRMSLSWVGASTTMDKRKANGPS